MNPRTTPQNSMDTATMDPDALDPAVLDATTSDPDTASADDENRPGDESQLGVKGRRTRDQIIRAARKVFTENGYFDSRLSDVTATAGCSTGTLYRYFRDRSDLLQAVIGRTTEDVLGPDGRRPPESDTGDPRDARPVVRPAGGGFRPVDAGAARARILHGNRRYVRAYARDRDLMHLLEQVSHADPGLQELRMSRAERFVERNTRAIQRLQAAGLADPLLDARLTAQALSSMVSRLCYAEFVDKGPEESRFFGEEGMEEMAQGLTRIWSNAIRLKES
ncbi:TetR/AcrR family transcriptional regulator [Brevibacterium litoralis]|uniref:TetR/AcrR family transcriptional regulator n=1 Tax=Brevibacterium litoralis TaxID=3138935 RepID=UPI0032ECDF71